MHHTRLALLLTFTRLDPFWRQALPELTLVHSYLEHRLGSFYRGNKGFQRWRGLSQKNSGYS